MLAGDASGSVLREIEKGDVNQISFTAYGHRSAERAMSTYLGFNGEICEAPTGRYLLGNGYRAFNPVLMRFHSPDDLSPFGEGGVNGYAYCKGDSVNNVDPSGHSIFSWLRSFLRRSNYSASYGYDHRPRSSVSSDSGGPARNKNANSLGLKMYAKGGVTRRNPVYRETSESSSSSPMSTIKKAFDFFDSENAVENYTPAVSDVGRKGPINSDMRRRPRYPLPHEREPVKKAANPTPQEVGAKQQQIRDQQWLKNAEMKKRSRDKFK